MNRRRSPLDLRFSSMIIFITLISQAGSKIIKFRSSLRSFSSGKNKIGRRPTREVNLISHNNISIKLKQSSSCSNKKHQNKSVSDGKLILGDIRYYIIIQIITASLHKCDVGISPSICFPSLSLLFWCFLIQFLIVLY